MIAVQVNVSDDHCKLLYLVFQTLA